RRLRAVTPSLPPASRQRSSAQSAADVSGMPKRLAWIRSHRAAKSANASPSKMRRKSAWMKAGLVRLALSRTRRSRMPLLHNPQSATALALSQSCTAEAYAQLREGFAKTRRDVIGGRDEA